MFRNRCFTLIVATLVVTLGLIAGCPPSTTNPCFFVSCDDGDACTTDICDGSSGSAVCSNIAVDCAGQVCNPANGACVDCLADADCDDGLFCNGAETCINGNNCVSSGNPCAPGETCDDFADVCFVRPAGIRCTSDADCPDDGLFCNGVGTCDLADPANGFCVTGAAPCAFGQTCTEGATAAICGGGGTQCTGDGACSALPACYSPGVALRVSITISAPSSAIVAALADSPPFGWAVNAATISDSGAWDSNNLKVKWAFIDNLSRTVTYDIIPPSGVGVSGTACFSGAVSFDSSGDEIAVEGDRCISRCGGD